MRRRPAVREHPAGSRLDIGVLIAAAGRGVRTGGDAPKQFREIGGVPMLLRAIRPFARLPDVKQIVVALPAEYVACPPPWLSEVVGGRLILVEGGGARAQSVAAALAALDPACTIVLVHDAARPFVSGETVEAVIDTVRASAAGVAAVPLADTLKRVEPGTEVVAATVQREGLWRAQTPQGFPRHALEAAFRAVGGGEVDRFTDEAALVEATGFPVRVVPDLATNLKITTAADFALAELLAAR